MKKITLIALLIFSVSCLYSSPRINFKDLLANAEQNPQIVFAAKNLAIQQNLPVNILTSNRIMIDAKGIEGGRVVYAVFTDLLDVYNGSYTAFYDELHSVFNAGSSRIDYGNKIIVDNTGGMFNPVVSALTGEHWLMVTDWTDDKVYLFNSANGDLIDNSFINPSSGPLGSPKHALMHPNYKHIVISDQITDLVQRFDTNGSYLTHLAPSTGVNTAILDNMRGIAFRPNKNLLVTVASGASQNTIQQFDSGGIHIGTFITGNLNSPFDILQRPNDILITNSSGNARITKFTTTGTYISDFYNGSAFAFPQQMHRLPNGFILVAAFSSPSGAVVLDSSGNFVKIMSAVSGLRGAYLLGNGHYLVTNASGVHEIDSANGSLIRTVVTGANYQYVSLYVPGAILGTGNNNTNIPEGFALMQNYPNPFNPNTVISFQLTVNSLTKLIIYDVLGNEVQTLINKQMTPGSYEVSFDGSGLASGVYYYKLISGDYSDVKKMVLIK